MDSRKSLVLVPSFSPPRLQFQNPALSSGQRAVLFKKARQLLPVRTPHAGEQQGAKGTASAWSWATSAEPPKQFCTFSTLLLAVAQLVETLRYKPEGRGFNSRWCR